MMAVGTEYPNRCALIVGTTGRFLLYLPFNAVGLLLTLWVETTEQQRDRYENGPCYERYVILAFATPILLVLIVISFIPAMFGLFLYALIYRTRRKVCAHMVSPYSDETNNGDRKSLDVEQSTPSIQNSQRTRSISIFSGNVCLLPSHLARYSNLRATHQRARDIAAIVLQDCEGFDEEREGVLREIPENTDIICLQEVFDRTAASILSKGEHHSTNQDHLFNVEVHASH